MTASHNRLGDLRVLHTRTPILLSNLALHTITAVNILYIVPTCCFQLQRLAHGDSLLMLRRCAVIISSFLPEGCFSIRAEFSHLLLGNAFGPADYRTFCSTLDARGFI